MPNKYYYNGTMPEKIAEEDREVLNDLMRSQKEYYDILFDINHIILSTLRNMNDDELKEMMKNGGLRIPVSKL